MQGENSAGAGPWTTPLAFEIDTSLIFVDGFESGDTTAWDTVVP